MAQDKTNKDNTQDRADRHAGGNPRKVESADVSAEEAAAQAEELRKLAQKDS